MYFPSKKDKWLSVLIGLTVSVFLADGLFNLHWGVFMVPFLQGYYFIKLLVLVSFSVLLLWIWFITGYKLEEEWLTIYYGPYRKHIYISEIKQVVPARDPFIAPV